MAPADLWSGILCVPAFKPKHRSWAGSPFRRLQWHLQTANTESSDFLSSKGKFHFLTMNFKRILRSEPSWLYSGLQVSAFAPLPPPWSLKFPAPVSPVSFTFANAGPDLLCSQIFHFPSESANPLPPTATWPQSGGWGAACQGLSGSEVPGLTFVGETDVLSPAAWP